MSVEPEKRPDRDLKVTLPQNNPFRRANSPMNSPPLSGSPSENRNSNNPFLDPDLIASSPTKSPRSPPKNGAEAGMRNLSLIDRPPPGYRRESDEDGSGVGQAASRLLQMKPGDTPMGRPPMGRPPPGMDPRGPPRQRRPEGERRTRTASEERRRRERHERRKKEREAGLTDSQGRPVPSQGGSSKSRRPRGPQLDAIDKLDSTGSFLDPMGSGYHVSGPYDATISRSNRKLRPIDAFAKDSLNMVMGGSKPNFDKHVHADARNMYGHVEDAVNDYTNAALKGEPQPTDPYNGARAAGRRNESFDPTSKVDQVHGSETTGLGTSTFLEGTPATANAIRRESESQDRDAFNQAGGLSRTRSLAQRFRNQRGAAGRDRSNSSGVVTSPERRPPPAPPANRSRAMSPAAASPGEAVSLSAGGLDRINESKNPFFEDYNDAYDRKGATIKEAAVGVTLEDKGSKPAPAPLTRSITGDSIPHRRTDSNTSSIGDKEKKDGGFLGRMKSFRGRKKEKTAE